MIEEDDISKDLVDTKYEEGKSRVLQELRKTQEEELFPASWSEDQIIKASRIVSKTNTAAGVMSSIPMRCKGSGCPYRASCPLIKHNMSPEGNPCPLELNMIITMFEQVCEELGVDPDASYIDAALIRDLCNVYIQEVRASKILADEHFIMENVMSIDRDGNPIYRKEAHVAIFYSNKLHTRKLQILNALIATREARLKATKKVVETSAIAGQADALNAMGILLSDLNKERASDRRKEYAYDIETADFEEEEDDDDGDE